MKKLKKKYDFFLLHKRICRLHNVYRRQKI